MWRTGVDEVDGDGVNRERADEVGGVWSAWCGEGGWGEGGATAAAHLVDDARQEVLQLLRLRLPAHHVSVSRDRGLYLRVVEVDHHPVVLEEVDLQARRARTR